MLFLLARLCALLSRRRNSVHILKVYLTTDEVVYFCRMVLQCLHGLF